MRKAFKSNQRRKILNRQHHKITSRRQSHFKQVIHEIYTAQVSSDISQ
jgi:hypothetical protein